MARLMLPSRRKNGQSTYITESESGDRYRIGDCSSVLTPSIVSFGIWFGCRHAPPSAAGCDLGVLAAATATAAALKRVFGPAAVWALAARIYISLCSMQAEHMAAAALCRDYALRFPARYTWVSQWIW